MPVLNSPVVTAVSVCIEMPPAHTGAVADVVTLALAGDVDLAAVQEVSVCLEGLLDRGHRTIRVDLLGVTFLDCAGVGVLIRMHHRLLAFGGSLTLTRMSRPAARLILRAELQDVLCLAPGTATSPRDRRAAVTGPRP